MLHHSLTKDGDTVSWGAIEDYHTKINGWNAIGYHYGVERIGGRLYALVGRPEDAQAAACKEGFMNNLALHICVVGNYDGADMDVELRTFLVDKLVNPLAERYSIPVNNIVGHRDYASYKSCPGLKFDLDEVRKLVR